MWYMWHIEIAYVLNFLKIIFSLFPHVAFKYLNIFFVYSNYLICCAVKMSEEYIGLEEDIEFVPPSGVPPSKMRHVRKTTAGRRKIQHQWTDAQIFQLITAVEKRRCLWDLGSPEYKLAKLDGWREVFSLSILIYSY